MNIIALVIFGTFGLIALLVLILTIIIYVKLTRRTTIKATIILRTGGQISKNVKRTETNFTINEQTYSLGKKAENSVLKTKFRDYVYYLENNPDPIIFDFENNKPLIQSDDFKTVLENDLIEKLFSMKILETIKLLLFIIIVICIITLALSGFGAFSGVNLKASPENYAVLINATKTAISGGYA